MSYGLAPQDDGPFAPRAHSAPAALHSARRARRAAWLDPATLVICALAALPLGCGDLLTTKPPAGTRFDQPLEGLENGELGDFQDGQTQFRRAFSISEGLGPIFNNVSCASCHSGDGRGIPSNTLTRFSRAGDLIPGEGGPQIQDKAIPGAEPERLPAGVEVSHRLPPPVFGVGLVEAIAEATILANEDPSDSNGDGVSGRANWVTPPAFVPATEPGGGVAPRVGRFGRKAQVSSLLQQTVDAYHQDMGITSPFRSAENTNPLAGNVVPGLDGAPDPEVGGQAVNDVMQYMRMLAPPTPGETTPRREQGAALFASAKCSSCHLPSIRTGTHEIEALSDRDVALYSDLLLHDLGDGLADNRPDGSADGREWRTAPLWGLRIAREFLNGQLFLLHDGRARSVEEAIRLHGGEATAARDAFAAMSDDDRAALLDFVESR
ncbi:MAG TPA: di-heme oxidoredictase family protein [Candidatus Eisenbacteria bacterium]|nr:di-heme oxidoredictase family protein [Candidatus Eisenbacteria bacterium]